MSEKRYTVDEINAILTNFEAEITAHDDEIWVDAGDGLHTDSLKALPEIIRQLLTEREAVRDKVGRILENAYEEQAKNTLTRTTDYERMQEIIDWCNEVLANA